MDFFLYCSLLVSKTILPNYIDHVHAKEWSSKNPEKVAMASSFTIVNRKKCEGERSTMNTFPKWSSSPWNQYMMYFYLVTYIMTATLHLSV